MLKFKLTKGELKRQRDALQQYERYLPTLQLKKQQLQLEIMRQDALRQERVGHLATRKSAAGAWIGLLAEPSLDFRQMLKPRRLITDARNIAGLDVPVFKRLDFVIPEYDLFITPLWVDAALEFFKEMVALQEEIKVIESSIAILRRELRITAQRVNLFEKVKIPEAKEAIRLIKIYLGDQLTNAVGRSKIAKRKIQAQELVEVLV
jgi:V/A-type H+-transporting ATPase subunit D